MELVHILGMDGNVLANYHIKSESAGEALKKNLAEQVEIEIKDGADIYIQTSGQKSLLQWEQAYQHFTGKQVVPAEFIEKTERDFRTILKQKLAQTEMYADAQEFLTWAKQATPTGVFVTTTVPLATLPDICQTTKLDKYVTSILARGGIYSTTQKIEIPDFDKGQAHYDHVRWETKTDNSQIIAISSTKKDIEIAKEQGVLSIGLEHIFNREQLLSFGADKVFADFKEVQKFIKERLKK